MHQGPCTTPDYGGQFDRSPSDVCTEPCLDLSQLQPSFFAFFFTYSIGKITHLLSANPKCSPVSHRIRTNQHLLPQRLANQQALPHRISRVPSTAKYRVPARTRLNSYLLPSPALPPLLCLQHPRQVPKSAPFSHQPSSF